MRKLVHILQGLVCVCALLFSISMQAQAGSVSETTVIIDDEASLLTEEEAFLLEMQMQEIAQYGNVGFVTVSYNAASTESYIRSYYKKHFGSSSGVIFMIDMNNRNIWLYCDGAVSKVIDNNYTEVITDNVYTYASDADYYMCAVKTFEQILTLLEGGRISQPMKYICNALMAVSAAMIINFIILRLTGSNKKEKEVDILEKVNYIYKLTDANREYVYTDRKYSPQSSGSSGGGGSGGGGSSGGHSF